MINKSLLSVFFLFIASCSNTPPSDKAIAAGLLTHAKHHNDYRSAGKKFTSSEEFAAKMVGDNTTRMWDKYQSNNTTFNTSIKDAQAYLDKSHIKINESFPKGEKPFVIQSK